MSPPEERKLVIFLGIATVSITVFLCTFFLLRHRTEIGNGKIRVWNGDALVADRSVEGYQKMKFYGLGERVMLLFDDEVTIILPKLAVWKYYSIHTTLKKEVALLLAKSSTESP